MLQAEREIQLKPRILRHTEQIGDVSKTCRSTSASCLSSCDAP
jgi:hypothetical protein